MIKEVTCQNTGSHTRELREGKNGIYCDISFCPIFYAHINNMHCKTF